jgi:hypothetical protein
MRTVKVPPGWPLAVWMQALVASSLINADFH